jgi:NADPH:quinone reductase-like Zn-dependent oxidoreductase
MTSTMLSEQKAIKIESRENAHLVSDAPIPTLRDDYILVKTVAVAINPTDWQHVDGEGQSGATVGCDYAGTVMEVGKNVTKAFAHGDRVCGFIHGSNGDNLEDGAFAEYVTAKGDLQIPIPDGISFEEAATLGVGMYDAHPPLL